MVVTLETDPISGELIMPIPTELLSQMGWIEGTELFWIDNENGTYSLKEKHNEISGSDQPSSNNPMSTVQLSKPSV